MARLRVQPAKSIANRAQLRCCIGRSPSISDVAQSMIVCPRDGRTEGFGGACLQVIHPMSDEFGGRSRELILTY